MDQPSNQQPWRNSGWSPLRERRRASRPGTSWWWPPRAPTTCPPTTSSTFLISRWDKASPHAARNLQVVSKLWCVSAPKLGGDAGCVGGPLRRTGQTGHLCGKVNNSKLISQQFDFWLKTNKQTKQKSLRVSVPAVLACVSALWRRLLSTWPTFWRTAGTKSRRTCSPTEVTAVVRLGRRLLSGSGGEEKKEQKHYRLWY